MNLKLGNNSRIFFERGFRPFFTMASIFSILSILLWILFYNGDFDFHYRMILWDNPFLWHGHEMIFGFIIAILSGFLLTAVPNWTSLPPLDGWKLFLLCLIWIFGRIAIHFPLGPALFRSITDIIFIPCLILSIIHPLFKTNDKRNFIFLFFLIFLFINNLILHFYIYDLTNFLTCKNSLYSSLLIILSIVSLIVGRIIPAFTVSALKREGINLIQKKQIYNDILSFTSLIILSLSTLIYGLESLSNGLIAAVSCLININRIRKWPFSIRVFFIPLLLILYIGYFWLIVGLALWSISCLRLFGNHIPMNVIIHILTIGCIGSLCLGMMTRVTLGHTGRQLSTGLFILIGYFLIQVSTIFRTIIPLSNITSYKNSILISGTFWIIAFLIYSISYIPLLFQNRVDTNQPFKIINK